jgi:hypothetical protein
MSTTPTISDYIENALPTWLGGEPVTPNEAAANQAAAAASIAAVAASPGAQVPAQTLLSNDTNLTNGQTYTFTFNAPSVSVNDLIDDINQQAPDFLSQVQVVPISGGGYNVVFVYEGDGSDVVQDVASAIVSAALMVNNDNLTFVSASVQTVVQGQTVSVGTALASTVAAQTAASNTDQSKLANAANAAAAAADSSQLTTIIIWVVVGVVALLLFAPKILAAGTPKVSVGGGA